MVPRNVVYRVTALALMMVFACDDDSSAVMPRVIEAVLPDITCDAACSG